MRTNRERSVLCGSASKAYAMTGWRCGWAIGAGGSRQRLQRAAEPLDLERLLDHPEGGRGSPQRTAGMRHRDARRVPAPARPGRATGSPKSRGFGSSSRRARSICSRTSSEFLSPDGVRTSRRAGAGAARRCARRDHARRSVRRAGIHPPLVRDVDGGSAARRRRASSRYVRSLEHGRATAAHLQRPASAGLLPWRDAHGLLMPIAADVLPALQTIVGRRTSGSTTAPASPTAPTR